MKHPSPHTPVQSSQLQAKDFSTGVFEGFLRDLTFSETSEICSDIKHENFRTGAAVLFPEHISSKGWQRTVALSEKCVLL